MPIDTIQEYIGKKIKVTYDALDGEDFYDVVQLNDDNEVVMERSSRSEEPFAVSQSWFKGDMGRIIEILK